MVYACLRGQRKFAKEENIKGYHRIERSYGEFVRSFAVPSTVDAEKVQADYKNGVLTIQLPKKEASKPPVSEDRGSGRRSQSAVSRSKYRG